MAIQENWRKKLYIIIFEADTKAGRLFDLVLLWAILLSVVTVLLDSDQSISRGYESWLTAAEWVFTILFSIEYIARLLCAPSPKKYARSFFGIIDLVSVAPTYLSLFIPVTSMFSVVRAVRLLRIFRILKLARYLQESRVLIQALSSSRIKITLFIGVVVTLVLIMGTLMHIIEVDNPGFSSIFKGMYWAVVTMTTVGYGDIVPTTALGQFVSSLIMIMGYGIIAVPTGIVSAEIANTNKKSPEEVFKICSQCKTKVDIAQAQFCHQCGAKL